MAFVRKLDKTNRPKRSNTTKMAKAKSTDNIAIATNNTRPKTVASFDPKLFKQETQTNLSRNLLSALECPVCMEYMHPPITLCENGHNICGNCRPRLESCPVCRCSMMDIRNVTLENIARDMTLPCPNTVYGCTSSSQLSDMANHLSACKFSLYECIFSKTNDCTWQGQHNKIVDHVLRYHKQRVLTTGWLLGSNRYEFEISNAECFNDCCFAITAFGEAFLYHKRFDIPNKKLAIVIQYFGSHENTAKFQIVLKLSKNNGNQKVNIYSIVHNGRDSVDTIFLSGECVSIHFDMLMSFTKGKKFVALYRIN